MPDAVARPVPGPGAGPGPPKRPDAAAIATRPTRHNRAIAFQAYVLGTSAVFVVLAVVAHFVAYFPIDLTITQAVQAYDGQLFDRLMFGVSWLGFFPQAVPISAVVILALFFGGQRWAAVATLFATLSTGAGALVKLVVSRPRPSAELVHVLRQLSSSGFPSGHVLSTTAFCGFLVFLCCTLFKPSFGRSAVLVMLSLLIALMGLSRIYLGQHWFSDVLGAYLFGSLWLTLTIRFYRWGRVRYFGAGVGDERPDHPSSSAHA